MNYYTAIDRKVESLRSSHAASSEEFLYLAKKAKTATPAEKKEVLKRLLFLEEKLTEMESQIEALTENDYSGDNPHM